MSRAASRRVRFRVDVKAFFALDVEAATPADAQRVADAFVESVMTAEPATIAGYVEGLPADAVGKPVEQFIEASVDGESDVTLADDEGGDE